MKISFILIFMGCLKVTPSWGLPTCPTYQSPLEKVHKEKIRNSISIDFCKIYKESSRIPQKEESTWMEKENECVKILKTYVKEALSMGYLTPREYYSEYRDACIEKEINLADCAYILQYASQYCWPMDMLADLLLTLPKNLAKAVNFKTMDYFLTPKDWRNTNYIRQQINLYECLFLYTKTNYERITKLLGELNDELPKIRWRRCKCKPLFENNLSNVADFLKKSCEEPNSMGWDEEQKVTIKNGNLPADISDNFEKFALLIADTQWGTDSKETQIWSLKQIVDVIKGPIENGKISDQSDGEKIKYVAFLIKANLCYETYERIKITYTNEIGDWDSAGFLTAMATVFGGKSIVPYDATPDKKYNYGTKLLSRWVQQDNKNCSIFVRTYNFFTEEIKKADLPDIVLRHLLFSMPLNESIDFISRCAKFHNYFIQKFTSGTVTNDWYLHLRNAIPAANIISSNLLLQIIYNHKACNNGISWMEMTPLAIVRQVWYSFTIQYPGAFFSNYITKLY